MNHKKHFNKNARRWVKDLSKEPEKYYASWFKSEMFSGDRAVDLGCGGGAFTNLIAKNFNRVYAVDFSSEMLKQLEKQKKRNIVTLKTDSRNTPFNNNSCDFVFSSGLMECLNDPLNQLVEIRRMLKPGKTACIRWLNSKGFWARIENIRGRINMPSGIKEPRLYSMKEIQKISKKAGFRVEEIGGAIKYPFFMLPFPLSWLCETFFVRTKLVYWLEKIRFSHYIIYTILKK